MADERVDAVRSPVDENLKPLIVYEGHRHPLVFVEDSNSMDHGEKSGAGSSNNIEGTGKCDACGKPYGECDAAKYGRREECDNCGETYDAGSKECRKCGKPYMNCGAWLELFKKCYDCGGPCMDSGMFCCVSCDFNLHLQCGPLPRALKQESHWDILMLKDFLKPDYTDENWYCDSCEEPRDKYACVYYCEACNYCAEIKCVMPELKLALTGKSGNVELRTLGRWNLSGKVISNGLPREEMQKFFTEAEMKLNPVCSLKDIFYSLNEDEVTEMNNILKTQEKPFEELNEDADGTLYGGIKRGLHLDEEFLELIERLALAPMSSFRSTWIGSGECVEVRDVVIPRELAPVYKYLYNKYGDDLSAGCKLSPNLKSVFSFYLCMTLEGMSRFKIGDVTEGALAEWFIVLRGVRRAGFKIQFAIDALSKILRAYFGLRVMYCQDKISQEIRSLEGKKESLKEINRRLKECHEYFGRVPPVLRECIDEAPLLKHKIVSEIVVGVKSELIEGSGSLSESHTTKVPAPTL